VLVADTQTIDEDTVATGNVLDNDSDVDNTLSVSSFSIAGVTGTFTAGTTATIAGVGTLVINSNGSYTFTPLANYNGAVPVVTYTTNTGSTSTLTINVTAVADTYTDADESVSVAEDGVLSGSVLTGTSSVEGSVSVVSFTIAGVSGTFAAGSSATIAGVGTLVINANGSYTFTPVANYNGAVPVVTYTTTDGKSNDTSTLTINVTAVNDPSVLVADTKTIDEDTVATGNVLDNDSDVDNTLTVASFTIAGVTGTFTPGTTATIAGVGALVINSDGTYTFTPLANYNGTVPVVTYTTNTGSTSTLNITVTAVADTYTDADESVSVAEDGVLSGSVLTGTSSVEGTVSVVSFSISGITGSFTAGSTATITGVGTLVINSNGSYTFTPVANYNGPVPVVTYTTTDGKSNDTPPRTNNVSVEVSLDLPSVVV